MKVKVLHEYRDAENFDTIHEKGEVLELEKERADRLQFRGLVEEVKETAEQTKETKTQKKK